MGKKKDDKKIKKKKSKNPDLLIQLVNRWELPTVLAEVSGITVVDEDRFACVQDEVGSIFIFNKNTGEIEREIPFAGSGDYEGIACTGESIFVIRADGILLEISNLGESIPLVTSHDTGLNSKDDVESLGFDRKNNRLLLTGKKSVRKKKKSIVAFDLSTRRMSESPAIIVDLSDDIFRKAKKRGREFLASAIGIHPFTDHIYITEGPKERILILNPGGEIIAIHPLKPFGIQQPEGISINKEGHIFISTEADNGPAAIVQIEFS